MADIVRSTLLYDYYGPLLTGRQQDVFENVVFSDLSLAEAAEEYGISRQGVHDLIRRCTVTMEGFEEKLGLIRAGQRLAAHTGEIERLARELKTHDLSPEAASALDRIIELTGNIREDI